MLLRLLIMLMMGLPAKSASRGVGGGYGGRGMHDGYGGPAPKPKHFVVALVDVSNILGFSVLA